MEDVLQYSPFLVGERPFCVWEWNLRQRNRDFLDSFDPSYFQYTARVHANELDGEHAQQAALSLRLTYSHAMEAFFSLVFASLQAPGCIFGWLDKYKEDDLRQLVESVRLCGPIRSTVRLEQVTWPGISAALHRYLELEDKAKETRIKEAYAQLWAWLAWDFQNPLVHREYNCIKHGMRVAKGGFHLSASIESTPGVPAAPEDMGSLGGSVFGTSCYLGEKIGSDKVNVRLARHARNWLPRSLLVAVDLMTESMKNIVSFLKVLNGAAATTVQFSWPSDLGVFDGAYVVPLVNDLRMDRVLDVSHIKPVTAERIVEEYERRTQSPPKEV
ncbi:MAG TPA: hypothetical protein VF515_17985 [Candidatus Binatia bacterium]